MLVISHVLVEKYVKEHKITPSRLSNSRSGFGISAHTVYYVQVWCLDIHLFIIIKNTSISSISFPNIPHFVTKLQTCYSCRFFGLSIKHYPLDRCLLLFFLRGCLSLTASFFLSTQHKSFEKSCQTFSLSLLFNVTFPLRRTIQSETLKSPLQIHFITNSFQMSFRERCRINSQGTLRVKKKKVK